MTSHSEAHPRRRFASRYLPWLVASGAFAVYLATINSWVTLDSLTQVAKFSGWDWQPELHGPAYWLITYPLRWLPLKAIPLALNLFSALCASLCLALLVRSVRLLPHDRTRQQREKGLGHTGRLLIREAWLPPLLAALVCGLQLSFWERATAASSQFYTNASNEMFDLLLFAYVIRCLLEFRVDQGESWLIQAAFVTSAGMTNNWAMIGFFPLFVVALVWLKGFSFFDRRFLIRIALSLLIGWSLYLLLPLVQSLSDNAMFSFWLALKMGLRMQASILRQVYGMRGQLWVLGLSSLVPVLLISIRWTSRSADRSVFGIAAARLTLHLVHALFLLVCIWVALDPAVSPRNKGLGVPFLTFYYLGALSVGYFTGYFLLIFGSRSESQRRSPEYARPIHKLITAGVWGMLFVTPIALVYRNLPQILITNGPMLKRYAGLLAQELPAHGAVVMSDDARRTRLLQSWAAQRGKIKDYVFVDAAAKGAGGAPGPLKFPEYHRFLRRRYGDAWPVRIAKGYNLPVDDSFLVQLSLSLVASNSLYYLHPSFGYYFEFFYQEPHGLVYELRPYPSDMLTIPPLPKVWVDENIKFWQTADEITLNSLAKEITPSVSSKESTGTSLINRLVAKAHLVKEQNHDAEVIAAYYSRGLDYWGVELQKVGEFTNAATNFAKALELNPGNVVAAANLRCNGRLQAGLVSTTHPSGSIEDEFGKARNWDGVIADNGPFDEPRFCFEQGMAMVRNNLPHQAAQQFDRVRALEPKQSDKIVALDPMHLEARLWLAHLYVINHLPSNAVPLIREIRAHPDLLPILSTNRAEMLFVETAACFANGDAQGAEAAVKKMLNQYPDDQDLLDTATQVYINFHAYSNALTTVEQQIKLCPTNMTALVSKGNVCIWLGTEAEGAKSRVLTPVAKAWYEQAIPPLDRALMVDSNNPYALLDRGIANLRLDNLDDAQRDYEKLQLVLPASTRVNYGLQEIAYRKNDTKAAIQYCQLYLAQAQTNTAEAKFIAERLKELKRSQR
jgi:tetratricopeptide (TPR) repeat protein